MYQGGSAVIFAPLDLRNVAGGGQVLVCQGFGWGHDDLHSRMTWTDGWIWQRLLFHA